MFWWCCADFSNMAGIFGVKKESEDERRRRAKWRDEQNAMPNLPAFSLITRNSIMAICTETTLGTFPCQFCLVPSERCRIVSLSALALLKFIGPSERLVIMRLGRTKGVHGPGGTVLVLPWVDKATCVDLRVSTLELPVIQSLTADQGMIELVATVFSQVTDPLLAHCAIQNVKETLHSLAYVTLCRQLCKRLLCDLTQTTSLDNILAKCQEELNMFVRPRGVAVERLAVTRLNVLKPADTGGSAMSVLHTLARSQLGQQLFGQLSRNFLVGQQQQCPLDTTAAASGAIPEVIIDNKKDGHGQQRVTPTALSPICEESVDSSAFIPHALDSDLMALLKRIRPALGPPLVQRVQRLFRVRCAGDGSASASSITASSSCSTTTIAAALPPEFDIDLRSGDGWCGWTWERTGPLPPCDVHFTLQKCTLLSLVDGSVSPMCAYLDGRVQIVGSVQDATLLKHLADALVALPKRGRTEDGEIVHV
uniref:Band 7 domain-containing protein n=1 Tax=Globodera rostochiensis TaxID=31243 RepID=A0A914I371_GLORO